MTTYKMNLWICPTLREIGSVDEVILCITMPLISATQMETALRFDSILRVATGAMAVFSYQSLNVHCSGSPSSSTGLWCPEL